MDDTTQSSEATVRHFIIDDVQAQIAKGRAPLCLRVSDRVAVLAFEDGSILDLTNHIAWGRGSDKEKRATLAKIAVTCGWAKSPTPVFRAMGLLPASFQGELLPPPDGIVL